MKLDLSAPANRVATLCVERRLALFSTSGLMMAMLATGILLTSFDGTFNALLTESDPYLDELEIMDDEFPIPTEAAFIFVAPDGGTIFDTAILRAIEDLRESYEVVPLADYLSTIINWVSPETQRRLFAKRVNEYSEAELSALAETAIQDRLLTNNLLAKDASLTFGNLSLNARDADVDQRMEIATAITQLRDDIRARHPDVELYVGSDFILEQSSQSAMIKDLTSLLPIVIIICVLVICYCFRSITLGASILIHVLFTTICTIGAVNYFGFSFNSISVIAPLVVIIIAVANSVHIISIYKQALASGMDHLQAMRHSLAYNFQPISLAAVTTAIGFSSLNMTSSPAIQDFGRIVAIGIVFAYSLTFTLLPALMVWFSRLAGNTETQSSHFLQNGLDR